MDIKCHLCSPIWNEFQPENGEIIPVNDSFSVSQTCWTKRIESIKSFFMGILNTASIVWKNKGIFFFKGRRNKFFSQRKINFVDFFSVQENGKFSIEEFVFLWKTDFNSFHSIFDCIFSISKLCIIFYLNWFDPCKTEPFCPCFLRGKRQT